MRRWSAGRGVALAAALMALGASTAARPPVRADVPVLLVPGWLDTERDLAALRIRMLAAGWEPEQVEPLTFRDPTGSNRVHAQELDSAARALLQATGAPQIDIVAHSMGGLATRWYLLQDHAVPVRRVAFVATPHEGTYAAYLAWGEGADEMRPGSAFLDTLERAPPVPEGVGAFTIRTPVDTHIIPGESARLDGVPDRTVCCPTHAGLLRNVEVFRLVRAFLLDGVTDRPDGEDVEEGKERTGLAGDGPLADTVQLILESFRHTMTTHRGESTAEVESHWLSTIGRPLRDQMGLFAADPGEVKRMVETYVAYQRTVHDEMVRPFPGSLEVVDALRARGTRMAVVTSKRRRIAVQTVACCGLTDALELLVCADDVDRGKPDPKPVLLALDRLELAGAPDFWLESPEETLRTAP